MLGAALLLESRTGKTLPRLSGQESVVATCHCLQHLTSSVLALLFLFFVALKCGCGSISLMFVMYSPSKNIDQFPEILEKSLTTGPGVTSFLSKFYDAEVS